MVTLASTADISVTGEGKSKWQGKKAAGGRREREKKGNTSCQMVACNADESNLIYLVCASANHFYDIKLRDVISSCAGWVSRDKI